MKRIILLLAIILLNNISCQADVNTRFETDIQLENCLEKSENYIQKTQCNNEAIKKYNKEIDEALLDLKSLVNKNQYVELSKTQESWEQFFK